MTMREELIKRLREKAGAFDYDGRPDIACDYEQAADAIEELSTSAHNGEAAYSIMVSLTNYVEELKQKMPRWIPMTERLPDEGKFVLVYGDLYPNKHDGSAIAVSKRMDWNYWQGFGRVGNITHWMPLPSVPDPPKEE